ncbi:dihydrodipicolinate synthase family protein [Thermophilibacter immobilis]|uniref:Dihydrodipicolinate synthase family protein n=1 Tax=Thermophilibacter immobilis TaxID=2779519 RepID=A0A7S7MAE3_9ACTN|nr:dihydrodipicolinate synthase family protein [Thermophilibacter immobilis]QOY60788.1 dihydrodipicolinate synthase family protein [Thermophilibacter immobilis]
MSKFQGVIVPMVTPFTRDDTQTISYEAAELLVEKLISEGASGIFTFGSNGEFHVCTPDEKISFSQFVIEKVAGRVPVYVGTGACSTHEAVELSKRAEAIGADALSVINPYFLGISDDQLKGYFITVAESVKVPVMLYNIPKATGMNVSPEVVREVAQVDNVRGVKDSSGNMDNFKGYLDAVRGTDVDVLVGSDGKISEAHALGASGAVAGTANLITKVVADLWNALESGSEREAERLQAEVEPIRDVLHLGSTPQTLKRALELAGYPVGPARFPVAEVAAGVDDKIRAMLDHYRIAHH